jgi:hypothetical protein
LQFQALLFLRGVAQNIVFNRIAHGRHFWAPQTILSCIFHHLQISVAIVL